jgi:RimJ/RimL family protein N-acetyltransferase
MRGWPFARRTLRPTTFTFRNRLSKDMRLCVEPWGEQFVIPPDSRLDLVLSGDFDAPAEAPLDVAEDMLMFFAPAGSLVQVLLDGVDQQARASHEQLPETAYSGSRSFYEAFFQAFPPAPRSDPVSKYLRRLGRLMGDGDLRLEPLDESHRADLKAACAEDADIWSIYAISYGPDHFDASFDALLARTDGRAFAIVLDDRLVGMSCYIGVDMQRRVLEIGNTYYVPAMRGTGLNRRVKALMISRAIASAFRRIEFRVDSRNARSQAAMAKLGAVREGVIRAERITWTGHVRDTVLFSILADEWPA